VKENDVMHTLEEELDYKSDLSSISLAEEHNKNPIQNMTITNLMWSYMHLHVGERKFQ
jgi:hypothetical protein